MKKILLIVLPIILLFSIGCTNKSKMKEIKAVDKQGYEYTYVENDPMKVRIYTLENGLKVYLSPKNDETRIKTYIAVKAGSNQDPSDNTGLAHYLEHMMFKGTSKIGTLDWEKEKELLKQISDLYEDHKKSTDKKERAEIYKKIDDLSQQASKYAIANEYDKMVSALGAKSTNAHTWFEETVYKNDIPSNELERWLTLERERFGELVLRLFHTELETVYEEYNGGQDSDGRRAFQKLLKLLFPKHPYGTQTTIGESEHLKSPSMEKIHEYFNTYYVPNNLAIVLSGDIEYDKTIALVDKHFGNMEVKKLPDLELPKEEPMTEPIITTVEGPSPAMLFFAFRTGGAHTKDRLLGEMFAQLMSNGSAGILDINLNKKQLVLNSTVSNFTLKDYGMMYFYGSPLEGQSLDDLFALIFEQIDEIKKGNIDNRLLEGAKNDVYKSIQSTIETNSRATLMYEAFISESSWKDELAFINDLQNITKQDVIDFANRTFNNNYVLIKKEQSEDYEPERVEKPNITPLSLNRTDESEFFKSFNKIEVKEFEPKFVDFNSEIKKTLLDNNDTLFFVKNPNNDLAELNLIWNFGQRDIKNIGLAQEYVSLLGTKDRDNTQLSLDLYALGINHYLKVEPEYIKLNISGIESNIIKGYELIKKWYSNAEIDKDIYNQLIQSLEKRRKDNTKNKKSILNAIKEYALYGENSDLRHISSIEELEKMDPNELNILKDLFNYRNETYFYGKEFSPIEEYFKNDNSEKIAFERKPNTLNIEQETKPIVYYVDYDMLQTEIMFVNKNAKFDKDLLAPSDLYNQYFGYGLSSVIFQELREAKALAYTAYSYLKTPRKLDASLNLIAYVGTQTDKLNDAVSTLIYLMKNMPKSENQFNAAKESSLKIIESSRIANKHLFNKYKNNLKLGVSYDIRKDIYNDLKNSDIEKLSKFFNKYIAPSNYTYCVIGSKNNVDFKVLKKLGKVVELKPEFLFNYKK